MWLGGEYKMNNFPLVSIIIPVYNSERYLSKAIESALAQTWPNKEIIIVDDKSTDNSLELINSFENKIVKISRQENGGASAARNDGLTAAKGDYIQFLDSDDILSADKVEMQVKSLNNTTDKIAVCSTVHFFDESSRLSLQPSFYEEKFIYTTNDPVEFVIRLWGGHDFNASMVQPNAWLTPRTLIEQSGYWNEKLSRDDDGEFFARIILNSKGIIKSEGLNYYRKYSNHILKNNLSSKKDKKSLESLLMSTLLKREHLFNKNQSEYAHKSIHKLFTELSITCYINEPELYQKVKLELNKLPRYRYRVIIGGSVINFISNLIGWKAAKKIQQIYSKYIGKFL